MTTLQKSLTNHLSNIISNACDYSSHWKFCSLSWFIDSPFFLCKLSSIFLMGKSLTLLDAFDTEQLLCAMEKLKHGQAVDIPKYDFKSYKNVFPARRVNFFRHVGHAHLNL